MVRIARYRSAEEARLPAIYRYLKQLELGRDALPLYKLLRRNPLKLSPELRWRVRTWLADKPALRELWAAKEAINRLYRIRGRNRAKRALAALTDSMAFSLPELRTLRRTLVYWRKEILAYFYCRLTNARTEGFNGKAKLAYGYRSFRNYRLRLLNSCA